MFRTAILALSAVHPLWYLATYLCAVPIFALAFCQIPHGFYAPYALLEYSGQFDTRRIRETIQVAIRRSVQTGLSDPNRSRDEWRWDPESIYVQRLEVIDAGHVVTFDLTLRAQKANDSKDVLEFPIALSLRSNSRLMYVLSGRGPEVYRIFQVEEPKWLATVSSPKAILDQITRDFTKVAFLPDESRTLSRYFEGAEGDALSISGSFPRMLYFSAMVITTVGFGDIVPMRGLARFLVTMEAIFGVSLAGLFINAIAYRASH